MTAATAGLDARFERERARAERAGQAHVLRFWAELAPAQRAELLAQLEALDYAQIASLGKLLSAPAPSAGAQRFAPPDLFALEQRVRQRERVERARALGRELLRGGRVGYVLVAGGQASRLGYEGPKGAFGIAPVSGRSLFELHARRLRAAARRHGVRVPWYVMTSPGNDAATRAFFAERAHFGLDPADVFFFSQDVLPALDDQGRILLAARHQLFLAPNGHGGLLLALARSGALADMRARGIEQVSYFQVDNPLAPPADELFLGLHAELDADMSSKVVAKRDAGEKVGVLGYVDERLSCIEYSDLSPELREARDENGRLRFGAGNIAMHALRVGFLERLTAGGGLLLPWHIARKQMSVIDEHGRSVQRAGSKFEAFVFDALAEALRSLTLEVERAHEFSPVKNKSGEDSPDSCRADLCRLHAGWVAAAGLRLPPPDASGRIPVEVDPLLAESAQEFCEQRPQRPRELPGGHLYDPHD